MDLRGPPGRTKPGREGYRLRVFLSLSSERERERFFEKKRERHIVRSLAFVAGCRNSGKKKKRRDTAGNGEKLGDARDCRRRARPPRNG